jgi:uncharacterized protein (TIRG00374 family)
MTSVIATQPARRWLLPTIWVALTIALAVALPRLPWERTTQELSRVAPAWVLAAVALNFLILPLWALEWTVLVPRVRVGFRRMFEIVALTAAVLNSVPMLAGEVSAVALLMTRAGLSRGAALSVLAMDQLLVAFAKGGVLALAAWLSPLPAWVRGGLLSLVAIFVLAFIVLALLAHRWERISEWLRSTSGALTLLGEAVRWGEHLETLRDGQRTATVALLAAAKKFAEILAVVAIQLAFGLEPSFGHAVVVVAALALSTLVPIAPANLGVYEATVFGVYRFLGMPAETALGLALVQHLCFLLPSLAPGYVMLTLRQLVPAWRRSG